MGFELIAIFAMSFVVGLSGAMMPGPLVTVTIAQTAQRGFRSAPLLASGHALVELAVVVGLFFGLSQLIERSGVAETIGLVGGAILIWMGYSMGASAWRGQLKLNIAGDVDGAQPSGSTPVIGDGESSRGNVTNSGRLQRLFRLPLVLGGAVSIANPYWLLWWATIGAAYIGRSLDVGAGGVMAFYLGHILSDFGWLILVAFVVTSGRRVLSQGVYRAVIMFCAAALVILGGYFLISSAPTLVRAVTL